MCRQYDFVECLAHLMVGESKNIYSHLVILDGEIARLVEEQLGSSARYVGCLGYRAQQGTMVEVLQAKFHVVNELGQ